jgi:DNA mismatch repair ATPase MutS
LKFITQHADRLVAPTTDLNTASQIEEMNQGNASQHDAPSSPGKHIFETTESSTENIPLDIKNISSPEDAQSACQKVQTLHKALVQCLSKLRKDQFSSPEKGQSESQLRHYNEQLIGIYKSYREWNKEHYKEIKDDPHYLKASDHLFKIISSSASHSLMTYNPYSETHVDDLKSSSVKSNEYVREAKSQLNQLKKILETTKTKTNKGCRIYIHYNKNENNHRYKLQSFKTHSNSIDAIITNNEEHLLFKAMLQDNKDIMSNHISHIENILNDLSQVDISQFQLPPSSSSSSQSCIII